MSLAVAAFLLSSTSHGSYRQFFFFFFFFVALPSYLWQPKPRQGKYAPTVDTHTFMHACVQIYKHTLHLHTWMTLVVSVGIGAISPL